MLFPYSEDVKFELEGKSDKIQFLTIVSNFKPTQGSVLFTVELPVVKIPKTEVSLEYEIANLQGKVLFKNSYNKQVIDLKWDHQGSKLVGDLTAKTNSVTKNVKFTKVVICLHYFVYIICLYYLFTLFAYIICLHYLFTNLPRT